MKNEEIQFILTQIQQGTGIGKLTQADDLDPKTKMRLFKKITEVKESNAAKSLVDYQESLRQKLNNQESNQEQLNAEFFQVLKEETDFQPEKVQIPIEQAADYLNVNDMEQASIIVDFIENE